MSSFEDLEVWKKSCRLAVTLYGFMQECREYGLRDQMLRAAISIPSNIAEGRERNSSREFQRYLNIAKGSAAELRSQVYIAREVNLFSQQNAGHLLDELRSISRMLQALHDSIKQ